MNIIFNNFNYKLSNQEIKNNNHSCISFGKRSEDFDNFERNDKNTEKIKQSEYKKLIRILDNIRFFKNIDNEKINHLPPDIQENIARQWLKFMQTTNKVGELDENTLRAIETKYSEFKKTPEGIRRAKMSDNEITKEVQNTLNEIYEKYQIPKEYQPSLEINSKKKSVFGGEYNPVTHTMDFYTFAYKMGLSDMESILAHEITHCKEALKRASIPQNRVEEVIKNQLLSNIKNGEEIYTLTHQGSNCMGSFISQINIPDDMKNDFMEFAKENLYNKSNDFCSKFTKFCTNPEERNSEQLNEIKSLSDKLEKLVENHPEVNFENMLLYSLSHTCRYQLFTNTKIGIGLSGKLSPLKVKEAEGEELKEAEKSLANYMQLVQANMAKRAMPSDSLAFLQYVATPEEVLAETNGQKFFIEKLYEKQKKMEFDRTLTTEDKTYFELRKKMAELIIKQLNIGSKLYESIKKSNLEDANIYQKEYENLFFEQNKYAQEILQIGKSS